MTEQSFKELINKQQGKYDTWRQHAEALDVPLSSLYESSLPARPVAPKVVEALGYKRIVSYRKVKEVGGVSNTKVLLAIFALGACALAQGDGFHWHRATREPTDGTHTRFISTYSDGQHVVWCNEFNTQTTMGGDLGGYASGHIQGETATAATACVVLK